MTFKPGVSGNPNGRPKVDKSLVALAREKTPDAIKTLAEIMLDKDASPSARVSAASELLDRGHGKAPAFITGDDAAFRRAVELTDDELAADIATARALIGGSGAGVGPQTGNTGLTH